MPTSVTLIPTITVAGLEAAFNAQGTGIELPITHIGFGTGAYVPTGDEEALVAEVTRVTIAGGGKTSPTSIQVYAQTEAPAGAPFWCNELGFYSNSTLVAVFSRTTSPILYISDVIVTAVTYALGLAAIPPNVVTVTVDPSASAALAALGAHIADPNAHLQYVPRLNGIGVYDATLTYGLSAVVIGDDGKVYESVQANNTANTPSTSPTWWGVPRVGTAPSGDVSDKAASTAFLFALIGALNGIASLDGTGKVPISQIPAAILGALNYQGTWNASTNTPALASGAGSKGFYYKVSVAGSTTIDGNSQWNIGDLIAFNGGTWDKFDGISSEVVSVFGRTGTVSLLLADVLTALGFTPANKAGDSFSGTVQMLNGSEILFQGAGNTYSASLRGDVSGIVGFINNAGSAWNLQIEDDGTVVFPRARPSWAGLTPWDNGNFTPGNYQPLSGAWNTGNFNPSGYQPLSGAWNTGNFNPSGYQPLSGAWNTGNLQPTTLNGIGCFAVIQQSGWSGSWGAGNTGTFGAPGTWMLTSTTQVSGDNFGIGVRIS
ncbi:phage tail protein [Paraburkholderia domus]|uniref:phage tail-collar fiber domain-containing protein n=1 Tax=Paraburkholderia domus TaxID=2793075 RepID=UPI0019127270|nr:phage tail protein [Paraburkholderia domus]MBK5061837.1 phage tail protein [Burkholderia sp. R-70199]